MTTLWVRELHLYDDEDDALAGALVRELQAARAWSGWLDRNFQAVCSYVVNGDEPEEGPDELTHLLPRALSDAWIGGEGLTELEIDDREPVRLAPLGNLIIAKVGLLNDTTSPSVQGVHLALNVSTEPPLD